MDDRYGSGLKALNISGGANRFKFEGKQARAKRVDVDVTHKVRAEGFLDADKAQEPDLDGGSFFQQELDRCKELNVTSPFKRFYYKVWPIVQSLAELVHHAPTVVDMLLALLEDPAVVAQAGEETLQLISVLGRDLQSSFFPYFPRVSAALIALIADSDVAPEKCGKVLRCLGYLLKFVARPLSNDMTAARALYAPLLGHRKDFARKMAAQCLAPAVRRLKPKAMRRHVKQLVEALAAGSAASGEDGVGGGVRLRADTLDGCGQLLFFVVKGVQGRTHSQAPVLLRVLLDSILPPKIAKGGSGEAGKRYANVGQNGVERAWCFELASAVLGHLVEHIRSPHSAELWLELHYGVGTAMARYRASMAAPDVLVKDCSKDDEDPGCAGIRRTVGLLSQAVGHMGGILLREQAIGVKQAGLLAEVLAELAEPDVFWHPRTSPGCRKTVVELLCVSLRGLYQQQRLVKVMPRIIRAVVSAPSDDGQPPPTPIAPSVQEVHPALVLSQSLLGIGGERSDNILPMRVMREVVVRPLLEACAGALSQRADIVLEIMLRLVHGTGVGLAFAGAAYDKSSRDVRETPEGDGASSEVELGGDDDVGTFTTVAGVTCIGGLPVGISSSKKLLDICTDCVESAISSLEGLDGREKTAPTSMPSEFSRAVAALRCLPILVASSTFTENARREAISRPLHIIERLIVLCSTPETDGGGTASLKCGKIDSASDKHCTSKSKDKSGERGGAKDAVSAYGVFEEGGASAWNDRDEVDVLRTFALEAGLSLRCLLPSDKGGTESQDIQEKLMSWHNRAIGWLRARPASIATLRAVALLLRIIRAVSPAVGNAPSCLTAEASLPIMDLLEPNLASESRLLRLSTMRVLASYDPLPCAGGTGAHLIQSTMNSSSENNRDATCNFFGVAEALEALPISIAAERDFTWRLGQLEVLGRSGRLPRPYARLMATHALGLLRVKFSGVWPKAVAIFTALCQYSVDQRELVWGPMHKALRQVMPPPPSSIEKALESQESPLRESVDPRTGPQLTIREAYVKPGSVVDCGEVENGDTGREGRVVDLEMMSQAGIPSSTAAARRLWVPRLLSDAKALDTGPTAEVDLPVVLEGVFLDKAVRSGLQPDSGEVPLWASTDADSAFAQVWGVLSQCPEILQKHSRTIVPLFLGFMQYQFLGSDAFPDDPEVRAVEIERHLAPAERANEGPDGWAPVARRKEEGLLAAATPQGGQDKTGVDAYGRTADRRSVRGRLVALLGVFASATGPKSLYKQRVLYRVYRALLVMPDDKIAGLALRCMLSYKPPFLVPYKTSLTGLMDEESFRNELVRFSLRSEGDDGSGKSESGGRDEVSIPLSAPTSGATVVDDGPSIDPLHRPGLLPVVIRLVYGRLSAGAVSRGRVGGGHGGPAAQRAAVLAFLSGLRSEELVELFALMLRPFLPPKESSAHVTPGADRGTLEEGPADWDDITGEATQAQRVLDKAVGITPDCLGRVSASRQAGFLKLAKEVARQLGQRALPYVGRLLRLVLALLEYSNASSETDRRVSGGEMRQAQSGGNEAEVEDDEADEEDLAPTSGATESAPTVRRSHLRGRIAAGALRALCLRALSEFFSKFACSFDFTSHQDALWPALAGPIERLPASTIGAGKAPALLTLAVTITESEALLPMLSWPSGKGGQALVPAVLDCISAGASGGRVSGPAVVGSALSFVERLLRYDEGRLLVPHLNRLISNFGARFSVTGMSAKGTGGAGGMDSHSIQGLTILARVAEMATMDSPSSAAAAPDGKSDVIDPSSMSELLALLVPSLHPDRRASDEAKSSILRTVSALALRVDVHGARRAWPTLSRLLGPAGARPSGIAAAGPRNELVRTFKALASRPDLAACASPAVSILADLNARDSVALDEPDFRRVVPAYNSLSEGTGWADVVISGCNECGVRGESATPLGGMLAAAPVVHHCFHSMHDQEVAVRGAAAAALKRLAREVVAARKQPADEDDPKRCPWEDLMRTVVMPSLRAGMACRTEIVRKGYISLLRETLSAYQSVEGDADPKAVVSSTNDSASMIPSDLWILARADDPESDFFMNACHMQIHRRARALAKARKAIEDSEVVAASSADGTALMATTSSSEMEDQGSQSKAKLGGASPKCPFRVSTLVHFILPLALHPLHEASKATQVGLVDQAIQLIGAVARHLPWTHYNSALRGLMQQVTNRAPGSDSPEQERAMVNALCGVLDGFHFALVPPPTESSAPSRPSAANGALGRHDEDIQDDRDTAPIEGDAVWRAVNNRLLASLRSLLTKEVRGKSGEKEEVLRAPVALGLMKLARKLPVDSFELELQPLLMTVCQSLKSRDSNARDTARDTLAKMACDLGPEYLHRIITELQTCLVTGYQLHVRTFTLHAILKKVADSYVPPNPPSVDIRSGSLASGAPDRGADAGIVAATEVKDASIAEKDEEMDIDEEAQVDAGDRVEVVPAIPSSLVRPPFDACIPQIVELLMDDLFGEIAAAKDAQGANVASSKMKEAKGQKANDSFEIVARTLLFRPTFTVLSPEDVASVSSVHALVGPVLKRLEGCESARDVGKAREVLTRIGIGLSANPTVTESEMLLYVHATVAPFLFPQTSEEEGEEGDAEERDSDDSSDSDAGDFEPSSRVKKGKRPRSSSLARKWITSEVNAKDQSRSAAVGEKRRREWESIQVLDGASAPKHTGRDRHDGRAAGRLRPGSSASLSGGGGGSGRSNRGVDLSDPAALGAVTLALGLLQSRLKAEATARGNKRATAMDKRRETVRAMADPFVPLLTRCIGRNPHTPVVLLSLKSLCYLLHWNLPSMRQCAPVIVRHVLARLVRGGVGGIRGEMGQTCFKALTTLFKSKVQVFGVDGDTLADGREGGVVSAVGEEFSVPRPGGAKGEGKGGRQSSLFGLSTKQLRALLVVLQMALTEMEHQNATFTLIKVVVSRKVMLPEVYDLMTKLAELSVTSHHPNMRITAGHTFLTFLLLYPLGEKRLQFHLKQIVNGVSYEHAEGRLAALSLCSQLLRRLPEPKLDELASVFYLALVVRLVNDPASECRAAAAAATNTLLKRVSGDVFHQLFDFTGQWFGGAMTPGAEQNKGGAETQDVALRRTAAQASGLFVQARPELLWKGAGRRLPWLLSILASMLPPRAADVIAATRNAEWGNASVAGGAFITGVPGECGGGEYDWEGVYHAVLSIGKAFEALPLACNAALSSSKRVAREGSVDEGREASSAEGHIGELFDRLLEALLYPHAWVRLAAARFWGSVLAKRHPGSLAVDGEGRGGSYGSESEGRLARSDGSGQSRDKRKSSNGRKEEDGQGGRKVAVVNDDGGQEFLRKQRVLFRLCQNFCSQLNRSQVDPKLMEQCVKNLVFIGRAMHLNPELCFAETPSHIEEEAVGGDVLEEDDEEGVEGAEISESEVSDGSADDAVGNESGDGSRTKADPLTWVFKRMSNMVVHKGEARRRAVFSWFAAMVAVHKPAVSVPHLRVMLLPLRRAVLDAEAGGVEAKSGVSSGKGGASRQGGAAKEQTSAELATEVMELLESKVGSSVFLEALTGVNMEIARKRVERKRQRAVEKATDPVATAERRKMRLEAGKLRKRRKVEEKAKLRGGTKSSRMRAGLSRSSSSRGRGSSGSGTRGRGQRGKRVR